MGAGGRLEENVQQARDRGGGFIHHGGGRNGGREEEDVLYHEGGVHSTPLALLPLLRLAEPRDAEVQEGAASSRPRSHSCLPCDVELGNQQETGCRPGLTAAGW